VNQAAWSKASRILAVRLDNMGDALMTGPALRALADSVRKRSVTLLASPAGAEAGRLLPNVDEVIPYAAPWMKATSASNLTADHEMIHRLCRGRFDAAVIFTCFSQSPLPAALLCYLAGIPLRLAICRENPYHLLTDWVGETEHAGAVRHEVRRQLDLVSRIGAQPADERLRVMVPIKARGWAEHFRARRGLTGASRWLVMHPGASAPSRRYPTEGFAAAARILAREHGCRVIVTGREDERSLVEAVVGDAPGVEALVEPYDLAALAALLASAPVVVANNSGPAHLAAAVGTPVVDLYALTNPQHTPWGVPCRVLSHDVPCKNCYKSICPETHNDCLRKIPPSQVVEAALELLDLKLNPLSAAAAAHKAEPSARDGSLTRRVCTVEPLKVI